MDLVPLFDATFEGRDWGSFVGPSWGYVGYHELVGEATGERLSGPLHCLNHPRQRVDGVWLPDFHGTIGDERSNVLFRMRGYNICSVTRTSEPTPTRDLAVTDGDLDGRVTLSMTFTADEPLKWLNEVFALVEGVMWAPMDESDPQWERWSIHVLECVNRVPWMTGVRRSAPAPESEGPEKESRSARSREQPRGGARY